MTLHMVQSSAYSVLLLQTLSSLFLLTFWLSPYPPNPSEKQIIPQSNKSCSKFERGMKGQDCTNIADLFSFVCDVLQNKINRGYLQLLLFYFCFIDKHCVF